MDIDLSPITENWRFLLGGLGITLLLSVLTLAGSAVSGTSLALGRLYGPAWMRWPIVFYIDSMRAVPVLVVLVWVYFAVPILTGIAAPPFWAALVALVMQLAAYVAEAVRAGIESIRPGQVRAGLALGMSRAQILRTILLPQALVRMLPAFGSILSITIKDTAIATVIAVPELMKRAETVAGQSYRPIEVYTVVILAYFLILFPSTRAVDVLYKRVAHLGRS